MDGGDCAGGGEDVPSSLGGTSRRDPVAGSGATHHTAHNTLAGHAVVHGAVLQAERIESLNFALPEPRRLPPPRQLPATAGMFVNRDRELHGLTAAIETHHLVTVSGLGGVGKTQLIAQWGERVAASFPDGQLYADLEDGRRDGAVDVSGVLADFLTSLGAGERMPTTLAARAALFRTATAGRRLLIVVDNVQHAPEVRPLVPGSGGARLVVLSRRRMPSFRLDGAFEVVVGPLDDKAGLELVRRWQHDALEEPAKALVQACGGLPLAMRAVGHRILSRPHLLLEDIVRDLGADDARTGDGGSGAVEGSRGSPDEEVPQKYVFDQTVRELSPATRELYAALGVHPGTTFTRAAAEAAGVADFEDAISELLTAHLALVHASFQDGGGHRFRLHDVVRAHARRYAQAHQPAERREAALRGWVGHYVERAAQADHMALGDRLRLQPAPSGAGPFTSKTQALEWLDTERSNLLAIVRAAAELRCHEAVWHLCESLWALYHSRKHYSDWIESHRLGIAAAQWDARPDAEVRMRNQLARAHCDLGEWERAEAEILPAAELLQLIEERRLHGVVCETQGLISLGTGRPRSAVELFTRALEANEGDAHGTVVQSYNLAQALVASGQAGQSLSLLDTALEHTTEDDPMRMRAALVRARAHRALGSTDAALSCAVAAATRSAELGHYAKLEEALSLTAQLADEVHDDRLRNASLALAARLRRLPDAAPAAEAVSDGEAGNQEGGG